jgi:hypothetical protein
VGFETKKKKKKKEKKKKQSPMQNPIYFATHSPKIEAML